MQSLNYLKESNANKNLSDLLTLKCSSHNHKVTYICLSTDCVDFKRSILCSDCYESHMPYHKANQFVIAAANIFSTGIVEEVKERLTEQEDLAALTIKDSSAFMQKIDHLYKDIQEKIATALIDSKENIRQILLKNLNGDEFTKFKQDFHSQFYSYCGQDAIDVYDYIRIYAKLHEKSRQLKTIVNTNL